MDKLIFRAKEKERLEKEKMERALRDKACPFCCQKVYPEQAIVIQEVIFHKTCVKCAECMRNFEGKDMMLSPDQDQKPYCKFCSRYYWFCFHAMTVCGKR